MPRWFRLDCDVFRNPKVAALSPAERCVWLESIAYAAEHATDGHIPAGWLVNVARAPVEYADTYCAAGLWKRSRGGGYVIHDYLQKQMSGAYWESRKTAGAKGAEKRWGRIGSKFEYPEKPHNDAGSIAPAIAGANATSNEIQELDTDIPETPSETPKPKRTRKAPRATARDERWRDLFAAMVEAIGTRPATRPEQGVWARSIDAIHAAHATPDQVTERAAEFSRRYSVPLTPAAIARHWGALAPTPPTTPPNRFGASISIGGEAA